VVNVGKVVGYCEDRGNLNHNRGPGGNPNKNNISYLEILCVLKTLPGLVPGGIL
jgi:hypothetical protein